jgi:DNA-binding PadR family transcriptional regulator
MAQKPQFLPNTSYTILGLLSSGEELSGYEIRKQAQNMRFFYWSPAQSQVYSELRRLETQGLVESFDVEQDGKPDKRLYHINVTGINELKRWLSAVEDNTTVVKHSVALKLFFGNMTTPEVLVEILNRFISNTKEMLGQIAVVQEYLENDSTQVYPAMVAEWGYHYYESELAMAVNLLERLEALAPDDK